MCLLVFYISTFLFCILYLLFCFFFFFFQAEDGIRDWSVTGVQTCALPISHRANALVDELLQALALVGLGRVEVALRVRSEERRVGKSVDLGGGRIIKKKK